MAIPHHKNVSSMESLIGSIQTDHQVYRWFLFLISQPAVQATLKNDTASGAAYGRLKRSILIQHICHVFFGGLFISMFLSSQLWLALLILPWAIITIKSQTAQKTSIVEISRTLLVREFDEAHLFHMTLYQIAEVLGRKYGIPSLVDTVYLSDEFMRRTIIFAYGLTCFIFTLTLWKIALFVLLAFHIVYAVINTSFIFRRMK